jgi:predicted AAA+ superfamily ATPase
MPISIDEFESRDPDARRTNAERVLRFLADNRDKAYKAVEIANAADVDENSIHPVLNRLEERGLVRHREPYWAVGDLDAIREATVFHSTAAFLDEELGPENREEWLAAARTAEDSDE